MGIISIIFVRLKENSLSTNYQVDFTGNVIEYTYYSILLSRFQKLVAKKLNSTSSTSTTTTTTKPTEEAYDDSYDDNYDYDDEYNYDETTATPTKKSKNKAKMTTAVPKLQKKPIETKVMKGETKVSQREMPLLKISFSKS